MRLGRLAKSVILRPELNSVGITCHRNALRQDEVVWVMGSQEPSAKVALSTQEMTVKMAHSAESLKFD